MENEARSTMRDVAGGRGEREIGETASEQAIIMDLNNAV
jgi:hypothetical protein